MYSDTILSFYIPHFVLTIISSNHSCFIGIIILVFSRLSTKNLKISLLDKEASLLYHMKHIKPVGITFFLAKQVIFLKTDIK